MTKKTQGRLVEKEEEKKREKRWHIFIPFWKISFLGGGIDTKIFVDRKKLSYFGQCAFVFGAKKTKKQKKKQFAFLFLSFLPPSSSSQGISCNIPSSSFLRFIIFLRNWFWLWRLKSELAMKSVSTTGLPTASSSQPATAAHLWPDLGSWTGSGEPDSRSLQHHAGISPNNGQLEAKKVSL